MVGWRDGGVREAVVTMVTMNRCGHLTAHQALAVLLISASVHCILTRTSQGQCHYNGPYHTTGVTDAQRAWDLCLGPKQGQDGARTVILDTDCLLTTASQCHCLDKDPVTEVP